MTTLCRECGQPFELRHVHGPAKWPSNQPGKGRVYCAEFCSKACNKAFNNRRMLRGAELYDVFMAMRFSRAEAETEGAWNLMCRMASAYKAQDDAQRDGRRSWQPVREIKDRRPEHVATVVERRLRAGR
jgi:hypothetical protein